MNRAEALPLILIVALALSCGTTERLTEPFASIIPSCADTVEAPDLDRENHYEPQNDNRKASWIRICNGDDDDLHVTMQVLEFETVSAAIAYVSVLVERLDSFGDGPGRNSFEDDDGSFVSIGPAIDNGRVFLYEDWPYLSNNPPISVTEGYDMDDASAGIQVVIRTDNYVIHYIAQHKVLVLIVRTGNWFAVLPFEDADMIQALVNQTLANRPFPSGLP